MLDKRGLLDFKDWHGVITCCGNNDDSFRLFTCLQLKPLGIVRGLCTEKVARNRIPLPSSRC